MMRLERRLNKMAVNFADAWKSHILQDFQFPQKFPQCEVEAGTLEFASQRLRFPPKMHRRHRLTPKLPQRLEVTRFRSRADHAKLALGGKTVRQAMQTRHAPRCQGCGTAT